MRDIEIVKGELQQHEPMKLSRLDDSLFSKDLAPHYMKLAGQLATSELVPKSFRGKPQDLFLCWAMGYQVGLTPEQAMQCIAIINGKATMYGDDLLALCMIHKDFEDILEDPIIKNDSVVGYKCVVKRRGKAPKERIFTVEMAKKAGLLAKGGVWNQYLERMLQLRARGFCLRDSFPDVLKGIKPREEVEDYIDADYAIVRHERSRTEQLKQDIFNKQGEKDASVLDGNLASEENKILIETHKENAERREEDVASTETYALHSEIKRLIAEKQFNDERLSKALIYYEKSCIEELSVEAAQHFIHQLLKL